MDWDDVRPQPKRQIVVGEEIKGLGVTELESRVAALEAEIARTRSEIDSKKKLNAAASAVFKS